MRDSNENRENKDNEQKMLLSGTMLLSILILSGIGLVVVGILYFKDIHAEELNNFEPWIQSFIGILLFFVGGVYVRTKFGKTRKGGTKYYTFVYRNPLFEKQINRYCNSFSEEKQIEAVKTVVNLVNCESSREQYWRTVYYLQVMDSEFVKAWNDFNFYENKKLKKDSDLEYFLLIYKYVYIKVYDTCNKIEI